MKHNDRLEIRLTEQLKKKAERKAFKKFLRLSDYIRKLIEKDLEGARL